MTVGSGVTEVPDYFLYGVGNAEDKLAVSFGGRIGRVGSCALNNANITNLGITLVNCAVGWSAFRDCPGATQGNIDFPQITSIDSSAFQGCTNIAGGVNLPLVTYIGSSAFSGCTGITSVRTPDSLTSLGSSAFSGCTSLIEAEIYGTGLDLSSTSSLFDNCTSLRRVVFGDGVAQ